MMVECPESIEELEALEQKIPLFRKELLKQVEARKEAGTDKSDREAARQLAEETGKKPETIRKAVQREKKKNLPEKVQKKYPHSMGRYLTKDEREDIKSMVPPHGIDWSKFSPEISPEGWRLLAKYGPLLTEVLSGGEQRKKLKG